MNIELASTIIRVTILEASFLVPFGTGALYIGLSTPDPDDGKWASENDYANIRFGCRLIGLGLACALLALVTMHIRDSVLVVSTTSS